MRILLSETRGWMSQGQNFGDECSSLSDGRAPQSRRLCRYGNYSLYLAAHTQWRRGHVRGSPRYFQHEKNCV